MTGIAGRAVKLFYSYYAIRQPLNSLSLYTCIRQSSRQVRRFSGSPAKPQYELPLTKRSITKQLNSQDIAPPESREFCGPPPCIPLAGLKLDMYAFAYYYRIRPGQDSANSQTR
jgi:hypothetical protein